jgi:hypothetical protein
MEEHSPKETDHPYEANPVKRNMPGEPELIRRRNGMARDRRTWGYPSPEAPNKVVISEQD